jgi:hypothetical protein
MPRSTHLVLHHNTAKVDIAAIGRYACASSKQHIVDPQLLIPKHSLEQFPPRSCILKLINNLLQFPHCFNYPPFTLLTSEAPLDRFNAGQLEPFQQRALSAMAGGDLYTELYVYFLHE